MELQDNTGTPPAHDRPAQRRPEIRLVEQRLYEAHSTIHPRSVSGWFASWRWGMVWFTQLLFYGAPWLTWNGRQAVLFDLVHRKFYIFGVVLWPQDFIYLAILLMMSALSLFLFTAIGGRLFCGYACPQTVYTEMFMWIERKIEGDRAARLRLDKAPWGARKLAVRSAKHGAWLALAVVTGFTFVGYFTPVHTLAQEIATCTLGPWETWWVCFYSFATYGNAGFMREQVCKYMCPYARFQSAMFDKDTLIITYDAARGEPRGARGKKVDPKAAGLGECVDCGLCVQVCPTGIDIRKGLQYECIGCAGCIDVCDEVMDKMGYPKGLVRYATQNAMAAGWSRKQMWFRVLRPRVLIYLCILFSVLVAAATSLAMRMPLKVDVLRDRGLPRIVEEDAVENVYRLQVMNTDEREHRYEVKVEGPDGMVLASDPVFDVPHTTTRAVPMRVQWAAPKDAEKSQAIVFTVRDIQDTGIHVAEKAVFIVPPR